MFDDKKTSGGASVSTVAEDDNEDKCCVAQLPGSDCEMEFDKDQDWMERDIPAPKQQPKANLTSLQG